MYLLKSNLPAFQVMSGAFARQRFEHGKSYQAVPDRYRSRFEKIPAADDAVAAPEEAVDPEESEEQGENDQ